MRLKTLAADVRTAETRQTETDEQWRQAMLAIPNPAADARGMLAAGRTGMLHFGADGERLGA